MVTGTAPTPASAVDADPGGSRVGFEDARVELGFEARTTSSPMLPVSVPSMERRHVLALSLAIVPRCPAYFPPDTSAQSPTRNGGDDEEMFSFASVVRVELAGRGPATHRLVK